jgi:hypothetical protein
MNRRGVCYDVGHVMGINWRPVFDVRVVHRELEIIRNDLHCNAVRIGGRDLKRVATAAEDALAQGLEVWFSPVLWDRSPDDTLAYIEKAAVEAEELRLRRPDKVVFVIGQEFTLFMQGIVPGKMLMNRVKNPAFRESLTSGRHNTPLNAFLARAASAARRVYHGPITYASLPFETVDWGPFDIVGIDHYRMGPAKERYVEMLEPLFATGKPVVNTEFGIGTYVGADEKGMLANLGGMVDVKTLFAHAIPLVGRLVRPRLNGRYVRDEALQARTLTETLAMLDGAGVDGAFVATFLHAINPYDEDPLYDLDMSTSTLVKTLTGGKHGVTYPDMPWEPKASFRAVAAYYGTARIATRLD